MRSTVLWLLGLAMVAVAPSQSHAADLTTLVSFCAGGIPCADGAEPSAGLIADAKGNLFGATVIGGANDHGTVFEIINTASGYVSTPTTLVICLLANCADGNGPSGLIADAKGNLFGTTILGGAFSTTTFGGAGGTVFEITDSGFVVSRKFDGTPGSPSCFGQSVSALAQQYGGFMGAADALDYPSVPALQDAILEFCEPEAADHANQRHHQANCSPSSPPAQRPRSRRHNPHCRRSLSSARSPAASSLASRRHPPAPPIPMRPLTRSVIGLACPSAFLGMIPCPPGARTARERARHNPPLRPVAFPCPTARRSAPLVMAPQRRSPT